MRRLLVVLFIVWASPVAAQNRNELRTVQEVARDYPGLINSGNPCGAFVDQVANRLNRRDGSVHWGRKARQSDGGKPNCDTLAYLLDPNDRSRKILVDIIFNSPDPGRDDPNAAPAWQEYLGDNAGNGYWLEPQSPDHDVTSPEQPEPPIVVPDGIAAILASMQQQISDLSTQMSEEHKAIREDISAFRRAVRAFALNTLKYGKYILPALGALLIGEPK